MPEFGNPLSRRPKGKDRIEQTLDHPAKVMRLSGAMADRLEASNSRAERDIEAIDAALCELDNSVGTMKDSEGHIKTTWAWPKRDPLPNLQVRRLGFVPSQPLRPTLSIHGTASANSKPQATGKEKEWLNFKFLDPADNENQHQGRQEVDRRNNVKPRSTIFGPPIQDSPREPYEASRLKGVTQETPGWHQNLVVSGPPFSTSSFARESLNQSCYDFPSTQPSLEPSPFANTESTCSTSLPFSAKPQLGAPFPKTRKELHKERFLQLMNRDEYQWLLMGRDDDFARPGGEMMWMGWTKGALAATTALEAVVFQGKPVATQPGMESGKGKFDWKCDEDCQCGAPGCPGTEAVRREIGRIGAILQYDSVVCDHGTDVTEES